MSEINRDAIARVVREALEEALDLVSMPTEDERLYENGEDGLGLTEDGIDDVIATVGERLGAEVEMTFEGETVGDLIDALEELLCDAPEVGD